MTIDMKRMLKRPKKDVELWFCHVQPEDLDTVELQLVSEINPTYNKQLKKVS